MSSDNESLASAFQRCRQDFSTLIDSLRNHTSTKAPAALFWEDEASRLQLWGANIGAAQSKANTSLDLRLRDADTVRQQIYKNLSDLDNALREALQCVKDDSKTLAIALPSTPKHFPETSLSDGCLDDDSDDSTSLKEDMEAAFQDVVSLINLLFRMTLYIRNPSRRDQLKHRDTSAVASFEAFDVSHIENKFPMAHNSLTRRLGQANTVRRANLRYWERHHKKLAVDETAMVDNATVAPPLSESVATTFKPMDEAAPPDTRSHFTDTSYMESVLGGETIRRPDLPQHGKNGAPFQCPMCCYIITVSGQREWMKHVFFDLQPYVCVFRDCKTPLVLYENRRDWFAHVMSKHLSKIEAPGLNLQTRCSLCQEAIRSAPVIRRHFVRHLEEVALFSLPNSMFGQESEMVDVGQIVESSSEEEKESLDLLSPHKSHQPTNIQTVDKQSDVAVPEQLSAASQGNSVWISGSGLSRHVLLGQLHYLLGPHATVRPYRFNNQEGYLITGGRLTTKQIEDLKLQSKEYERQQVARGTPRMKPKILATNELSTPDPASTVSVYYRGQDGEPQFKRRTKTAQYTEGLWTEITKDLVAKEAIREMGYKYEETDEFFYILQYLEYDQVAALVAVSENYRMPSAGFKSKSQPDRETGKGAAEQAYAIIEDSALKEPRTETSNDAKDSHTSWHPRREPPDLTGGYSSDPESHKRRHRPHDWRMRRISDSSRSKNTDDLIGAAGRGLIGDLIFPGSDTAAGALGGSLKGRDQGVHGKEREEKGDRAQENWEDKYGGQDHSR